MVHRRITGRSSGSGDSLPFIGRLFKWFPFLRALPARLIGLGPRPEHVHTPDNWTLNTACWGAAELTAETRKASARILVRRTHVDLKFIIPHLAENISRLNLATEFAGGSPVQKAHFPAGIIKKIRPPHSRDLFG
ncbi:MAG TPA: hypothetical protein DIT76_08520 [Spartobacteria bacterium]|nr:hypothetical protein [Spartobacteria bacterium]HCP92070.1 hypothetical protein [Spartobacteria bacterium]